MEALRPNRGRFVPMLGRFRIGFWTIGILCIFRRVGRRLDLRIQLLFRYLGPDEQSCRCVRREAGELAMAQTTISSSLLVCAGCRSEPIHGHSVLSASAPISPLGWHAFVELPAEEAYASLYDSIRRCGVIIFAGLVLAFQSVLFLARRTVVPIPIPRNPDQGYSA
jgi:hypothetical protein